MQTGAFSSPSQAELYVSSTQTQSAGDELPFPVVNDALGHAVHSSDIVVKTCRVPLYVSNGHASHVETVELLPQPILHLHLSLKSL